MNKHVSDITIREANDSDFNFFYSIKSEINDIRWTGHQNKPDYNQLLTWFIENLRNSKIRKIYIITKEDRPVGYIYVDKIHSGLFGLSIGVSESASGQHIGRQAIREIVSLVSKSNKNAGFEAWIREDNIASIKAFTHAGFKPTDAYQFRRIESLGRDIKMIRYIRMAANIENDNDYNG